MVTPKKKKHPLLIFFVLVVSMLLFGLVVGMCTRFIYKPNVKLEHLERRQFYNEKDEIPPSKSNEQGTPLIIERQT